MDEADEPTRRLWLVFFGPPHGNPWWQRFLKKGFGHVEASSYYAATDRWVHVNPTRRGLVVEVYDNDRYGGRLQQLLRDCTAIVRMPSKYERNTTPLSWWCVGAIKSLLGIRTSALSPYQLYRDLLQHGAEIVEVDRGLSIPEITSPPGRSECESAPRTGSEESGGGSDLCDPRPALS